MGYPSIKRIMQVCNVGQDTAKKIRGLMENACEVPARVDKAFDAIDKQLETFGVEAVRDNDWAHFYGDIGLLYCNAGDSYAGTILYDTRNEQWHATTLGDLLERPSMAKRFE